MSIQDNIFRLFIFVLLYFQCIPESLSQDEAGIRKMLESGDQKKLNKDDKFRNEADNLMHEVNKIYLEIRSIRQDSALNKRDIKNKTRLLEKQSWQKQVQASALYEKGNNQTYSIYKKYLNSYWKDHEGEEPYSLNAKMHEEQARDNYAQANLFRRDARHMNMGIPKVEKLTEANHLESAAIRKQVISLGICYGISEQSITVDSILAFPVFADTTSQPFDTGKVTEELVIQPDEIEPEPAAASVPQEKPIPVVVVPVLPAENEDRVPVTPDRGPGMFDQTIFRIQISASRTLLTFDDLAKINPGEFPVEVVSEGGWLKYQFLGVPLYADVQRIFREANAKGSFIVSYRNGIKQNLPEMISISRELEKRIQVEGKNGLVEETFYHLEIAVSKTALKATEIAKIYNGPEPVLLIMDRGLYKYHLNAGYSSEDARMFKQKTGLTGTNVVAYKNARPSNM